MGHSLAGAAAFVAFWLFLAVAAVAGMAFDYRKRKLAMETLRAAIERGEHVDPAVVEQLLVRFHQPEVHERTDARELRPYLHIGGIITIASGVGVALASLGVGLEFPVVRYPILGAGVVAVCVGIGLLIAARALKHYGPAGGSSGGLPEGALPERGPAERGHLGSSPDRLA